MIRSYSEMLRYPSFMERFRYLMLNGQVGDMTFGGRRYLNQAFYSSSEWKRTRRRVIIRDNGCDLGVEGYEIHGPIYVHHLNPITMDDIEERSPKLFDMDNLICVSYLTHEAITYGSADILPKDPVVRKPNDTCPWRKP